MAQTALIAGASGIAGNNLARHLLARGWEVTGLARRPPEGLAGLRTVAADLLDPAALQHALRDVQPDCVFITTWLRQPTEADNIRVNAAMVRNLLQAVPGPRHVALVTGMKHYLGPFEAYGKGNSPDTPFREEQPRLDVENFYYAQEDELFAAAERGGFGWSVHRAHTVIGSAVGAAMNMGTTLAVYASICRQTGRSFTFPGNAVQWNGLANVTDARQLARHLEWAAITPAARNQALNVVNGDVFRWRWLWPRLAAWFGVDPAPPPPTPLPLEQQLAGAAPVWAEIAAAHGLREPVLERLASPWHTDADLSVPFEVVVDMTKSRRLGFTAYQPTEDSFLDLFTQLREDRLIP